MWRLLPVAEINKKNGGGLNFRRGKMLVVWWMAVDKISKIKAVAEDLRGDKATREIAQRKLGRNCEKNFLIWYRVRI